MKLIKRMLMGMVSLTLLMGQDPTQGGGSTKVITVHQQTTGKVTVVQ